MDTFRWITIVVSTILGLGIARSLAGGVAMFQHRRTMKLDWLCIVWAGVIFAQQILFWWSLEDLSQRIKVWNIGYFILLVLLVVMLFLASSIIMPPDANARDADHRTYFVRDGRWALLAVALFNLLAIVANALLWQDRMVSWQALINALGIAIPVATFRGTRQMQIAGTAAYIAFVFLGMTQLVPLRY